MMYAKPLLLLIFIGLTQAKENEPERTVTSRKIQVDCNGTSNHEIVVFKATSTWQKDDVIYYIFTGRVRPTVIMRHVYEKVAVSINDDAFCNGTGDSVVFSDTDTPLYSGIFINKVFPFIDKDDDVRLSGGDDMLNGKYNLAQHYNWTLTSTTSKSAMFHGTSSMYSGSSIDFSIKIREKHGNSKELPGYPTRANLTEFRLELDKLTKTYPDVTKDDVLRYSVEVVFFLANRKLSSAKFKTTKSIDDEYTPGTFKIWGINFPLSDTENTYGSWKPVAYTDRTLSIEKDAFAYNNIYTDKNEAMSGHDSTLSPFDQSVIWTAAGDGSKLTYFGVNITFGQPKDGGYGDYLTWAGMVGSGKTPFTQDLSSFAITVITIGLGGPAVAGVLIGILVALVRKLRGSNTPRSKYDLIN